MGAALFHGLHYFMPSSHEIMQRSAAALFHRPHHFIAHRRVPPSNQCDDCIDRVIKGPVYRISLGARMSIILSHVSSPDGLLTY